MSIEAAIKTRLDTTEGMRAKVGKRTYAVRRPSGSPLPSVTFQVVSEQPVHAMGSDAGVKGIRIRVSSWSKDFTECREVDELVRSTLSRYRGTSASVVVQDILEETAADLFHGEADEGIFQRARDFRVFYEV